MRFVRYQLPALLWALLIFISSSLPAHVFPSMTIFRYDKLIHLLLFGMLALFVYRALTLPSVQYRFSWPRAILTVILVTLFGAGDEVHQHFIPGRSSEIADAVADFSGASLTMLLLYLFSVLPRQKNTSKNQG
jgi:VanZ family protein